MKKSEIRVGKLYKAKVNNKITTVRVDRISDNSYYVTNLTTGRTTVFRSAARFRSEGEHCSDPTDGQIPLSAPGEGEQSGPFRKTEESALIAEEQISASSEPPLTQPATEQAESAFSCGPILTSAPAAEPSQPDGDAPAEVANHKPISPLAAALANRAPKPAKHPPTAEQQAILDAAAGDCDVLLVQAGAGSGKTSTEVMLAEALPGQGQYTAFNAALVADGRGRFPPQCPANTIHSLAFRAEGKRFAHRLNKGRVRSWEIAKRLGIEEIAVPTDFLADGTKKTLASDLLTTCMLGALRNFCQSADGEIAARHFRRIDGIDAEKTYANNNAVREYLLPFAQRAWADLSDPTGALPFAHEHYLKVWELGKPVIPADYLLTDEVQDFSGVMLSIVRQQKCKKVMVGDSAQAIYGFLGCLDALKEFPGAPVLYLSQSFRFGDAIAAVANEILGLLQDATPMRLRGLPSIPSKVGPIASPRAILCRTNAIAVGTLLEAIAAGKRPFLVGGGGDVIKFVEGCQQLQAGRAASHPELACFSSWNELKAFSETEEGSDLKLLVGLIAKFGCEPILKALRSMPEEKDADLVITTAHRSKGRQWLTVRLAADFPTKSKSTDDDLKLLYVAATRAQMELDVSRCPFFTGEDSLDLFPALERAKAQSNGAPAPAPAPAPRPPETAGFSWTRWGKDDRWMVRGPRGAAGEVDVVKRDGRSSRERLGAAVWESSEAAVYEVVK